MMQKIMWIVLATGFILASNLGSFVLPEVKTKPVTSRVIRKISNKVSVLAVVASAYSPPLFPEGQATFSGLPVGWGVVAVDPEIIPLGSIVHFPGYFQGKKFVALDTGKDIQGNRVDIWLPSEDSACRWGIRRVGMVIAETKKSP